MLKLIVAVVLIIAILSISGCCGCCGGSRYSYATVGQENTVCPSCGTPYDGRDKTCSGACGGANCTICAVIK